MNKRIEDLTAKLKVELVQLYGERLKGLYLFGSYARNEADEESDVDILIVLDQVGSYSREIELTGEVVSRLSLWFGTTISRAFTTERQWSEEQTLFLQNVREEAVLV